MQTFSPFNSVPTAGYPNQVYAQYKQPSMNQPLTPEEQNELANRGGTFNTQLTRQEVLKSMCTHKNANGWVLVSNNDGSYTCPICQSTFTETSLDQDHVKEVADEFYNIMQMIKTYYVDIPIDTARELFPMMALARRLPEYAQIALTNFGQYERGGLVNNGNNPYGYAAYQTLLGGNMGYGQPQGYAPYGAGYPMQQAPMVGQPMTQVPGAGYVQQPGYAPVAPAPQQWSAVPQGQPGFVGNNEFGAYGYNPQPPVQGYGAPYQQPQGYVQQPVAPNQGNYQNTPVMPNANGQVQQPAQAAPQPQQSTQQPATSGPNSVDVSSFGV